MNSCPLPLGECDDSVKRRSFPQRVPAVRELKSDRVLIVWQPGGGVAQEAVAQCELQWAALHCPWLVDRRGTRDQAAPQKLPEYR